jgi:hypothetical protein
MEAAIVNRTHLNNADDNGLNASKQLSKVRRISKEVCLLTF